VLKILRVVRLRELNSFHQKNLLGLRLIENYKRIADFCGKVKYIAVFLVPGRRVNHGGRGVSRRGRGKNIFYSELLFTP
ncbi:MAG: hypothetical protein FWG35_08720, partial [Spirochaetaceae bacterium]|nr:hypothetical protein [Spirochaetaceae bacterium]